MAVKGTEGLRVLNGINWGGSALFVKAGVKAAH